MNHSDEAESKSITLTIDSRLANIPLVGMLVNRLAMHAGLTEMDAYMVELCAVEAATNSIKHAYEGKPDEAVEIRVTLHPREVILDIMDSGKALDQARLEQADSAILEVDASAPELLAESGRGLAIIKAVMDRAEYTSGIDKNRFTLVKSIAEHADG